MADTFTLPTTIGSIVTFVTWADTAKTEKFRYVTTLIAGAIDNGKASNVVWGDAFTEEGHDVFSEETILAGDPTLLFQADENPTLAPLVGAELEANYGETVTYDDEHEDIRLTVTYTPGIIDQESGELSEAGWVNSYGGWTTWDKLVKANPAVIVKGTTSI
jgi:hypothetical protein